MLREQRMYYIQMSFHFTPRLHTFSRHLYSLSSITNCNRLIGEVGEVELQAAHVSCTAANLGGAAGAANSASDRHANLKSAALFRFQLVV